jgi:pilus assembly protein CpaB
VTAYIGYRISDKKPAETIEVIVPTYSQVIARNNIAPGHVLTAEDLEVVATQQQDKQAFSQPSELIGKTPSLAVSKGATFKSAYFPTPSPLGQALAPHERAVAIKVNEVVGVGGFIKPGDHVDVLLYLRTDRETGEISSSQVVLSNVKVLAYGTLINEVEQKPNDASTQPELNKLGTDNSSPGIKNAKDNRSAVLAVADKDIAKLMLADSSGMLRLALRGEALAETDTITTGNQFIRLGDLSQASGASPSRPARVAPVPAKVSTQNNPAPSATKRERIIIHRGEQMEVVNVAK